MLYKLYRGLTTYAEIPLTFLLRQRLARGKEDTQRWPEKTGIPSHSRPEGNLIWVHAASVGETQSALILIEKILQHNPAVHILMTSGTVTSATFLTQRLPARTCHQFLPLDHPQWVRRFLDHWRPDFALWLESELWPNFLHALRERDIPCALVNARLSEKSFHLWQKFGQMPAEMLQAFSLILCQTKTDAAAYQQLGAKYVHVSGNLKYSATPLPVIEKNLKDLQKAIGKRPCWVYASTHAHEEELAARLHQKLTADIPDLLTLIVPRHPNRGEEVFKLLTKMNSQTSQRTEDHIPPEQKTALYLCDTLGELGLFYRLCPIAVIGRSFSADGGGGHNPIEAAQLDCAVLYGPHVQNLQDIYDNMAQEKAAIALEDEEDFARQLHALLTDEDTRTEAQTRARAFVEKQESTLEFVWDKLIPYLDQLNTEKPSCP